MKAFALTEIKAPLMEQDRPDLVAGAGEVVVQLKTAALNRRDYWITRGMYPGIEPPVILGSDGAGVVVQVGDGVGQEWMDQEVIISPSLDWGDKEAAQADEYTILGLPRDGTFATHVAVPVEQLHVKPQHLNWEEAAALPLAGLTAYRAVFRQGELQEGETLLVTGIGGGVATFALQFGIAAGAVVWATSSSADKLARAQELGATGGANYQDENWWKELARAGVAPNVVIDGAGGPGCRALINLTAAGGRIVNYGATAGPPEQLDLFKVFWKQLRIQGTTMGSPRDFSAMLDFVAQHSLRPIVDRVFPLSDVNEAITEMKRSPQFGKYVLQVD